MLSKFIADYEEDILAAVRRRCAIAATKILNSYKNIIGIANIPIVKGSVVGVTTAATIRMTTI